MWNGTLPSGKIRTHTRQWQHSFLWRFRVPLSRSPFSIEPAYDQRKGWTVNVPQGGTNVEVICSLLLTPQFSDFCRRLGSRRFYTPSRSSHLLNCGILYQCLNKGRLYVK